MAMSKTHHTQAQTTAPAARGTDRRRWIALAVIVAAQFMVVLDVAIVNVALPTIKTDLNFSQENLQWVVTAYSILFGGGLLLGGPLGGPSAAPGCPTSSAAAACSSPGWRSSPPARSSTASPGRRAR